MNFILKLMPAFLFFLNLTVPLGFAQDEKQLGNVILSCVSEKQIIAGINSKSDPIPAFSMNLHRSEGDILRAQAEYGEGGCAFNTYDSKVRLTDKKDNQSCKLILVDQLDPKNFTITLIFMGQDKLVYFGGKKLDLSLICESDFPEELQKYCN